MSIIIGIFWILVLIGLLLVGLAVAASLTALFVIGVGKATRYVALGSTRRRS